MTKSCSKEVKQGTVDYVLSALAAIEVFPWNVEDSIVGSINIPDNTETITVTQLPIGGVADCQNQDQHISSNTPGLSGEVMNLLAKGAGNSFKVGVRHHGEMRVFQVAIS